MPPMATPTTSWWNSSSRSALKRGIVAAVSWRDATRDDVPQIERLWAEQQAKFAELAPTVQAAMPKLFLPEGQAGPCGPYQPPILRVLVAERSGEVVACRTLEAV